MGRSYASIYKGVQRGPHHRFVEAAVEHSGGRVLSSSGPSTAPLFLGVEDEGGKRLGICAYVFLANGREIEKRPRDEHRFQIRFGNINDAAWRERDHPVGFDPLEVDVTLVMAAHIDANLIVGVDPLAYAQLPIGISIFFKDKEVEETQRTGWHVWERDNVSGVRRPSPRTALGVETVVGLAPERLLDYVRFERDAQSLGLEPPLRFRAAQFAANPDRRAGVHALEREMSLSAAEIMDIIRERPRLGMAVRGGVAERHLQRVLKKDPTVAGVELAGGDAPPDFVVTLDGGRRVRVECKNASRTTYADGTPKVETQKTRASKGDPKSRLYEPSQFDVVAASLFGPTGRWEFRYKRSELLERHRTHRDRIAPIQRIDETWGHALGETLDA